MDADDEILEALLATRWKVQVDAAGNITAERHEKVITGRINTNDGSVTWSSPMGWALKEARILRFQRRIAEHKASQ